MVDIAVGSRQPGAGSPRQDAFWIASAAVAGLVAGITTVVFWVIIVNFVAGLRAVPDLGIAGLAGLAAGVAYCVLLRNLQMGATVALWSGVAAAAVVMFVLSGFAPFGLALGEAPIWGGAGTVLLAAGIAWVCAFVLGEMPAGAISRHQVEGVVIRFLKALGLSLFAAAVAIPFYVMVVSSFKTQAEFFQNPLDYRIPFEKGFLGLFDAYYEVLTTYRFGRYIMVSAAISICTVATTLALAIPGAYAVSRLNFPGRVPISRSILLIYMFPAIVLVIPLYSVFSSLGLRNTFVGLLIVYTASTLPVALYMLQGYFRSIPKELEEAGIMDGCTRMQVILKITLPLALPAVASVSLYVFMIAWNEFLFAFMFLDDPDIFTLSRGLVSLDSSEVPREFLMAGSVIVTVPVLVVFLAFERFLVGGLTAGSVKG